MPPRSWSFMRLIRLSPSPRALMPTGAPQQRDFEPARANIPPPENRYPRLSLLGLPPEIRDQIWECISDDIRNDAPAPWFSKPITLYDGLTLVCRQIYYETEKSWRRLIIPRNRLIGFLNQPFSRTRLQKFTSLSIEIPFNMPEDFFRNAAAVLEYLSPFLQELRLFFTGPDAYGVRVYLHGCGNHLPSPRSTSRKLMIDGQGIDKRLPLIHSLAYLRRLRVLVLANLNLPLLQAHIVKDKPYLEKLYLVDDPRTTLHIPYNRHNAMKLLVPVTNNLPQIKELQISANATLTSLQIVLKASFALEHLTWIVPDASRQAAGSLVFNWHTDTGILVHNLRRSANRLHTLRICMEGSTYEGHSTYGMLIGDFRAHVPFLTSLKRLELHLWLKSPWLGCEFVEALPKSLERFYLSDRLLDAEKLIAILEYLYLGGEDHAKVVERTSSRNDKIASANHCDENETIGKLHAGEDLGRKDFIPMRSGNLGFVGYEYDVNPDGQKADLQKLAILKLNGRLLDREHNKHLAIANGGHIQPRMSCPAQRQGQNSVEHKTIEVQGQKLRGPTYQETQNNLTFLEFSPFKDDCVYFGMEKAAERVFKHEKVADAADVLARTYPMEVQVGELDHWMCS